MGKKVIDFNKYYDKKQQELKQKQADEDLELFKELISKSVKDLEPEKALIYNEIGVICSFPFKEIHRMVLAVFRDQIYVLNILGGGQFEYIGKIDDIIDNYLF